MPPTTKSEIEDHNLANLVQKVGNQLTHLDTDHERFEPDNYPTKTYSFVASKYTGNGKPLFVPSEGKSKHSEQLILKKVGKWPQDIWINNSPCPNCAHEIGEAVKDEGTSHVIYFQIFYTIPNTKQAYKYAINCGAYLKYYGVELKPFEWEKFAQEAHLDSAQKKYLQQIFTSDTWGKINEKNEKALQDIQNKYNEIKDKKPDEVNELCKAQSVGGR